MFKDVDIVCVFLRSRVFILRQKPRWPTSKSIQAFLATVPPLCQVNGKTVPPGESWQCTTKTGDTY